MYARGKLFLKIERREWRREKRGFHLPHKNGSLLYDRALFWAFLKGFFKGVKEEKMKWKKILFLFSFPLLLSKPFSRGHLKTNTASVNQNYDFIFLPVLRLIYGLIHFVSFSSFQRMKDLQSPLPKAEEEEKTSKKKINLASIVPPAKKKNIFCCLSRFFFQGEGRNVSKNGTLNEDLEAHPCTPHIPLKKKEKRNKIKEEKRTRSIWTRRVICHKTMHVTKKSGVYVILQLVCSHAGRGERRRRRKTKLLLLLFVLLPQLLIVSSSSPPFVFGRTEFGGTFWTRFQSGPSCWLVSFGGSRLASKGLLTTFGGVAQMVERSLSMREVPGSIPGASSLTFFPSRIRGGQTKRTCNLKKSYEWSNV